MGTTLDAHIVSKSSLNDPVAGYNFSAIIPEVRGPVYITGLQYVVLPSDDPFHAGFSVHPVTIDNHESGWCYGLFDTSNVHGTI
jgi:proline racemase